jgi:hypothetical protein
MAAVKKRPAFKRRQYKLNWLQIVNKLREAYRAAEGDSPPQLVITLPLRDAIEALQERLELPADWIDR